MKKLLFIAFVMFFVACGNGEIKDRIANDKMTATDLETSFFDIKQDFKIISFEQSIDETSSANDAETACDGWSITKDECKKLMTEASVISGVEWHHSYYVLPCIYSGEIRQDENTYEYKYNSGDWFVVYNADSSIYLANGEPEIEH